MVKQAIYCEIPIIPVISYDITINNDIENQNIPEASLVKFTKAVSEDEYINKKLKYFILIFVIISFILYLCGLHIIICLFIFFFSNATIYVLYMINEQYQKNKI